MLFELLMSVFTIVCFLLVFIIFVQKGKGSMGLGSVGGGTQMLFGGSGGQDIFQKVTWVFIGIYLFGSLGLGIYKSKLMQKQGTIQR